MAERVKMSIAERAKQFSPFAALKGYDEMIAHAEEKPCEKEQLSEERAEMLSDSVKSLNKGDVARVRYYYKDRYVTLCGMVSAISPSERYICIVKTKIGFDDIYELKKAE